jgi:hypothetical protein
MKQKYDTLINDIYKDEELIRLLDHIIACYGLNERNLIITPSKFLQKSKQDQFWKLSPEQKNQNLQKNYTPERLETIFTSNSTQRNLFLNYFELTENNIRLAFDHLVSIDLLEKPLEPSFGNGEYIYILTDEGENFIGLGETFKQFSEYKKELVTKEIFNSLIDEKLKLKQLEWDKIRKNKNITHLALTIIAIIISIIALFKN